MRAQARCAYTDQGYFLLSEPSFADFSRRFMLEGSWGSWAVAGTLLSTSLSEVVYRANVPKDEEGIGLPRSELISSKPLCSSPKSSGRVHSSKITWLSVSTKYPVSSSTAPPSRSARSPSGSTLPIPLS